MQLSSVKKWTARKWFNLLAVIVLLNLGLFSPSFAGGRAGYDQAPPAVQMSYKLETKTWFAFQLLELNNEPMVAAAVLGLINTSQTPTNDMIDPSTPGIDFGYHVIAAKTWAGMQLSKDRDEVRLGQIMEGNHLTIIKQIPNENMRLAAEAYVQYTQRWELGETQDLKQIERGLFSSILLSAGRPLTEADTYLAETTTPEQRTTYVTQVLIPTITQMKQGLDMRFPPEGIRDPNSNWYRVKLVQEATHKLGLNYLQSAKIAENFQGKKVSSREKNYNSNI